MFVRSKVAKGQTYYAVVENYREGPKVRQRSILSLGTHKSVEDALTAAKATLRRARRDWKRSSVLTEFEGATFKSCLDKATARVADLERVAATMKARSP